MDHISILSINTRGTQKNYPHILDLINKYDIVLLQEQIIDKNQVIITKLNKDTNRKVRVSTDKINNRSIMILVKPFLEKHITNKGTIIEGRMMFIELKINNKNCNIINLYAPANQQDRLPFFQDMFRQTEQRNNLILAGDFNTITDKMDTDGQYEEKHT